MEGGGRVADDAAPDVLLRRLSTVTFRGLRGLLAVLRARPPEGRERATAGERGRRFRFRRNGRLAGSGTAPPPDSSLEPRRRDIGDLLDGIDEHEQRGESERWAELLDKISAFDYGLRSQLRDLDDRLDNALGSRHVAQALEALDDTRSSASEGIFALLSSVYAAFLPEIDPTTVAPGHLTALGRALLVRRGLTDLMRAVSPRNDTPAERRGVRRAEDARALDRVRTAMTAFVKGEVFRAMRPADRWELTKFERSLREQSGPAAT